MADPFDNSSAMADPFSYSIDAAEVSGGQALGRTMLGLAAQRDDIVLVAADVGRGPATMAFVEAYPERYFDVGIAENNSIGVAAGLAASGLRPFVIGMGAFLALKCAEQIRTDIAMNRLPVTMVAAWGGVEMGYFGTTHLALEDFAVLRGIPNLAVAVAADPFATDALVRLSIAVGSPLYMRAEPNEHPTTRRMSSGPPGPIYRAPPALEWGKVNRIRPGDDISLIATGVGVSHALEAASILAGDGIEAAVIDVAFIKPFDSDAIVEEARRTSRLIVVEEHSATAGLGSLVAEALGRSRTSAQLATIGFPDEDLAISVPSELFERYGVNADSVVAQARTLLDSR
jgi:transketolase